MKRLLSVLIILSLLISLAGCKWFKKEKKPADTVKLNGVSITEYKIVCDKDGLDYNVRAAEYIRDSIAAKPFSFIPTTAVPSQVLTISLLLLFVI